ncbi:hypothetical protein ABVK25_004439 [Lepraria finkii]|uniref:Uncharacterized protein n=1 Tax=Lepraria finkii TaxID=1340010 RepID=A0ABR4BDI8_9LECA
MTKDLVRPEQPSDSDDDSFTMPPPPTIKNGGLHFAPTPTSPSDADTFATPAAPMITTMENRPPVIITEMSQLITSHVPVLTICPFPLPGPFVPTVSEFPTAAYNSSTPPTPSGILHPRQLIASRPVLVLPIKTVPFYLLYSPNISCSISYTPTTTPVCHTALSPFAAPVILITVCDQSVAFSSEYEHRLVPGKSASVETLTTCLLALWQDLHRGMVLTANVLAVVCSSGHTDCTTENEFWEGTITKTFTTKFTTK